METFKKIMIAMGVMAVVLLALPTLAGALAGLVGFMLACWPAIVVIFAICIIPLIVGVFIGKK